MSQLLDFKFTSNPKPEKEPISRLFIALIILMFSINLVLAVLLCLNIESLEDLSSIEAISQLSFRWDLNIDRLVAIYSLIIGIAYLGLFLERKFILIGMGICHFIIAIIIGFFLIDMEPVEHALDFYFTRFFPFLLLCIPAFIYAFLCISFTNIILSTSIISKNISTRKPRIISQENPFVKKQIKKKSNKNYPKNIKAHSYKKYAVYSAYTEPLYTKAALMNIAYYNRKKRQNRKREITVQKQYFIQFGKKKVSISMPNSNIPL